MDLNLVCDVCNLPASIFGRDHYEIKPPESNSKMAYYKVDGLKCGCTLHPPIIATYNLDGTTEELDTVE